MMLLIPSMILGIYFAPKKGTSIGAWYNHLKKPSFNPPKNIFGIVWSCLYILMGLSVCKAYENHASFLSMIIFIGQYWLTLSWGPIFFGRQSLIGGQIITSLLIPMIVATMYMFYQVSFVASFLLLPYLCWSIFAWLLAYRLAALNLK
jgi:translocator protein